MMPKKRGSPCYELNDCKSLSIKVNQLFLFRTYGTEIEVLKWIVTLI